jgi:capsular exopolysaccharide synthesis family protein
MDGRGILLALRHRLWVVLLLLLVSVGAAVAVVLETSKVYEAHAQIFVATQGGGADVEVNPSQSVLSSQQRVTSYAAIVTDQPVTEAVINQLGLRLTPGQLASKLSASAPANTVLINISARDHSPSLAAQIANATATQLIKVVQRFEKPAHGSTSPVTLSISQTATAPSHPVSPEVLLDIVLGAIAGLVLGAGIAVLWDVLDSSVKSSDELDAKYGLPALAVVPYDSAARKRPLITQEAHLGIRAEAYRSLRTNLMFVDVDEQPGSLVITSAVSGDGKSTTACNLAIMMTQLGVRAILVEGDLRRPSLADYLGIEGAAGLTFVLSNQLSLDDAVQQWGPAGSALDVLTAGKIPPNPGELLSSARMAQVVRELERRYELVIIDAPPLLGVSDAAVLARYASGAVLVVRQGSTKADQIRHALRSLQAVDAKVFGAILNWARGDADPYAAGRYAYATPSDDVEQVEPAELNEPVLRPAGQPVRNGASGRSARATLLNDGAGSRRRDQPESPVKPPVRKRTTAGTAKRSARTASSGDSVPDKASGG